MRVRKDVLFQCRNERNDGRHRALELLQRVAREGVPLRARLLELLRPFRKLRSQPPTRLLLGAKLLLILCGEGGFP